MIRKLYMILVIIKIFILKMFCKRIKCTNLLSIRIEKNFILDLAEGLRVIFGDSFAARTNFILRGRGFVNIGNNVVFNNYCSINCFEKIDIGDNCMFGENVKIYDHNHIFNKKDLNLIDSGFKTAPINIGKNVWVGSNVTLLKGITIGDNSVIAAGSTVRINIPSNSIYSQVDNYKIENIIFS